MVENSGVLRARSDRPVFLVGAARLGAHTSEDDVERIECEWAGVARTARGAASEQWKADKAAAWLFKRDRSRAPPECLAPPPLRDGENNLTFANASAIFSLSIAPKFICELACVLQHGRHLALTPENGGETREK